jgi:hypothetical protein
MNESVAHIDLGAAEDAVAHGLAPKRNGADFVDNRHCTRPMPLAKRQQLAPLPRMAALI